MHISKIVFLLLALFKTNQATAEEFPPVCVPTEKVRLSKSCRETARTYQRLCKNMVTGNFEGLMSMVSDQAKISTASSTMPWSGEFVGREGFGTFLGKLSTNVEIVSLQVKEFSCNSRNPSFLYVHLDEKIKGKATGQEFLFDVLGKLQFRKGKLTSFRVWEDTAAGEQILGLNAPAIVTQPSFSESAVDHQSE